MLLACVAPLGLNGYGLYLLTLTEIFALVALGLNLLTGYAGQISLCHAAFFGVGAYATAILTQKAGVPYLLSLFAGALFTTAIGALAAMPALRLKNIYLAIATLGFGVVLQKIIFEWRSLTGGGGGLALTAPRIAGYELGATGLYYLTLALMSVGLFGAWNVSRGRTGRALLVIKDSEIAAGSLGIHAARYKVDRVRHQRVLRGDRRRPVCLSRALHQSGKFQRRAVDFVPEHGGDRRTRHHRRLDPWRGVLCDRSRTVARHQGCAGPRLRPAARRGHGVHAAGTVGHAAPSLAEVSEMTRLAIEDVSVDFGGIHALRDVTFALESGSIVGLIGPNGAGKSTLLNCISGITRPTKGKRPARRGRFSRQCRRRLWRDRGSAGCSSIPSS